MSECRAWSSDVIANLITRLGPLNGIEFEIHAGASYRNRGLVSGLMAKGSTVTVPAEGLNFGQQLQMYAHYTSPTPATRSKEIEIHGSYAGIGRLLVDQQRSDVTFTFNEIEGAIGRQLPPSARRHQAWWSNSGHAQARSWTEVGWQTHHVQAASGVMHFRRLHRTESARDSHAADRSEISIFESAAPSDARTIADALIAYGAKLAAAASGQPAVLCPDPEANRFVTGYPFAFLLAVIFDQGITAERAWSAPWELRNRIGHLDPKRIIDEPQEVRRAVQSPPSLHRFVEKIPEWIIGAAQRVVIEYDGRAGNIWAGAPTAELMQERLRAFDGIGQKKAAMAVEILERHLGVAISELEGSDVAYDVHVRRVFLRAGLSDVDSTEEVIKSARALNPERPGVLDYPAWEIGRRWCRPSNPRCDECVLGAVCPRLIDRAAGIRGI